MSWPRLARAPPFEMLRIAVSSDVEADIVLNQGPVKEMIEVHPGMSYHPARLTLKLAQRKAACTVALFEHTITHQQFRVAHVKWTHYDSLLPLFSANGPSCPIIVAGALQPGHERFAFLSALALVRVASTTNGVHFFATPQVKLLSTHQQGIDFRLLG